ncbi:MAG: hypothetical protein ACTHJ1_13115 [Bordetella sp.]|uniref:hypothetical protein n=1 Tax=Bordetella sp. TaxID=28081 RepID=UPI003F7C3F2E
MNIACLTCFVPRKENVGGPSGLLYRMIQGRPAGVTLTVYLFGQNLDGYEEVPEVRELSSQGVRFVRCAPAAAAVPAWWPKGVRQIAGFAFPDLRKFDAVWAYPYWFAPMLRHCEQPVVISGMDCATMLYWRKLKASRFKPRRLLRDPAGLLANLVFEARYLRGRRVHVVGRQDARVLACLGARPVFVPHPFLDYDPPVPVPRPAGRPLTILMSGLGDAFYGTPLYLDWIRTLCHLPPGESKIELVLHKASREALQTVKTLTAQSPRITVQDVAWVDDYARLLQSVDLQLFPLEIGAGTKTSVLTALQHQVRAVCTPVAAENIEPNPYLYVVKNASSDLQAALRQATDAIFAGAAALPLMDRHLPAVCAQAFWQIFEKREID